MAIRLLFVNAGFVDEHHGDLIANGIKPVTGDAP